MLELVEAALDAVASLVDLLVVWDRPLSGRITRDDSTGADVGDAGADVIAVVSRIGQDVVGSEALHQGRCLWRVAGLARGEDDPKRAAPGVGGQVDLGGQSAS